MLRKKLFGAHEIYRDFKFDKFKVDMQGWGSDHPILPWLIEEIRPQLVIEVGSWKGRSAINMANKIKSLGLNSEILCIDTWLGSPEHWLQDQWRESLNLCNGRPNLYETFITNVIDSGLQNLITPLPVTSEAAFYILNELKVKSEFIYIDAGHEYESVYRDITMYWELLAENGVLLLDDYIGWPGVTRAVHEFAIRHNLIPLGEDGKAILTKNRKIKIESKLIF